MTIKAEPIKEVIGRFTHTINLSTPDLSSSMSATTSRNKVEIQRELLFRCKGKIEDVSEILKQTKTLEAQPKDIGNQKKELSLNV